LHNPDGKRLIGFDNAHGVPPLGSGHAAKRVEYDHWHRAYEDEGRPYRFVDAGDAARIFFAEVRRVLQERGVSEEVTSESDTRRRKP